MKQSLLGISCLIFAISLTPARAASATVVVGNPDVAPAALEQLVSTDPLTDLDAPLAIEEIYARFAQVASASGRDVNFSISNVQTYGKEQFDELLWIDLFTEPGGWTLETVPHSRVAELPSADTINYLLSWEKVDASDWQRQEFLKTATSLHASQALSQLGEWDSRRLAGIGALSSFEISVDFDGRQRSYRALVLWKALSNTAVLFNLMDHVVPGINLAYHESRRVVTAEDLVDSPATPLVGQPEKACLNFSTDSPDPAIITGQLTEGHANGNHNARLRTARSCSMSGCTSRCTPRALHRSCNETGQISNPLFWHKRFSSVRISTMSGVGTQMSQCGYAWGCAVRKCLFGACFGVSFGISGGGASLNINANGSVLADMSLSQGGFCPAGEVDIDPPGCDAQTVGVQTLSLTTGEVRRDLPSNDFTLRRLEESDVVHDGQPIKYLMGEWALLSHDNRPNKNGPAVKMMAASNQAFALAKKAEMENVLGGDFATKAGNGKQLTLVVAIPPHEANSRHIPMPQLKVRESDTGKFAPRKILVRADFGEDHQLQNLQFLHDSEGGVPYELALQLEQAFSLETFTDDEHRAIIFAVVDVGETLNLEGVIPYLPKCCCGAQFCI